MLWKLTVMKIHFLWKTVYFYSLFHSLAYWEVSHLLYFAQVTVMLQTLDLVGFLPISVCHDYEHKRNANEPQKIIYFCV